MKSTWKKLTANDILNITEENKNIINESVVFLKQILNIFEQMKKLIINFDNDIINLCTKIQTEGFNKIIITQYNTMIQQFLYGLKIYLNYKMQHKKKNIELIKEWTSENVNYTYSINFKLLNNNFNNNLKLCIVDNICINFFNTKGILNFENDENATINFGKSVIYIPYMKNNIMSQDVHEMLTNTLPNNLHMLLYCINNNIKIINLCINNIDNYIVQYLDIISNDN